jgi:predicted ATPase
VAIFPAFATIIRGWALAEQERPREGLEDMHRGLEQWKATGTGLLFPFSCSLLAEGLAKCNKVGEALKVLEDAHYRVRRTNEHVFESELHRLKGSLLLTQCTGNEIEAEARFRKALEVAHDQGAKSFELRAAASLARLWRGQGRVDDARTLLAPVYGWFTEGFDTPDLIEARDLLDALD